MKITCITVGKKHDKLFAPAIAEYEKRLSAYVDFKFEYIPNAKNIAEESVAIMKRLQTADKVILLDGTGELISNKKLAGTLESFQGLGIKRLIFIIGGAYGVSEKLQRRSDKILSLSNLVYPHQIVRLILVEQLYRSFNIVAGGKYHHG